MLVNQMMMHFRFELAVLKGFATTITSASKLAEVLKACLPTLTAVLHL